MSFNHPPSLLIVFLLLAVIAYANPCPIDDIFDVADAGNGDCTPHRRGSGDGLLDTMFEEVELLNSGAVSALADSAFRSNFEIQKLARSLLGIASTDAGAPVKDMDNQKLGKAKEWFNKLEDALSTPESSDKKPQMYCDSSFLEKVEADTQARNADGSPAFKSDGTKQTVEEAMNGNGEFDESYWFWIPAQNGYLTLPKTAYSEKGSLFGGASTYCAWGETFGWTIEPAPDDVVGSLRRTRPIIVVCPKAFTKKNKVTKKTEMQKVDTSKQPINTPLDAMGTLSLTLYHEMFHWIYPPTKPNPNSVNQKVLSPDAPAWTAKKVGADLHRSAQWPAKKEGFWKWPHQVDGALQCMSVALYDMATPVSKTLDGMLANKNPESYVWISLAIHLSTHGAKQDWSIGFCRDSGSPAADPPDPKNGNPKRMVVAAAMELTSRSDVTTSHFTA